MKDYIVRATAENDAIRIFAATTSLTVETARKAHNTSNVITAALGRLMTAAAMMGSMQKSDRDVLTLKIGCAGPAKGLTVTACSGIIVDEDGIEREGVHVKGYPDVPRVDIPLKPNGKLDVSNALGAGILTVIKDMGLKEPFSGQVELVSGEIAEDLTYYFASSEQVPSAVALGVLVGANEEQVMEAGGFIIQLLPFASDEVIEKLEQRLSELPPVTAMLNDNKSPEEIVTAIFGDMDLQIMDRIPVAFACNCSKERVSRAIQSIEAKDIEEMIEEDKPIEVNCHFCNTNYSFSVDDLKEILARKHTNEN